MVTPDYVEHDTLPGIAPGREGIKQMMSMMFGAFPDMHSTTDALIAERDTVVGRHTTIGTHRGESMGILQPASG